MSDNAAWKPSTIAATYLVAGCRPWNRRVFDEVISRLPGQWAFVASHEELTEDEVARIHPRYIFFLHWSWAVPDAILHGCECVCFHMTDVPYGRGGSPLQNLIARGQQSTKLTALRMITDYDAGPVYSKEDLSLGGAAEEILIRADYLAAAMIERILIEEPAPIPQVGDAVQFMRRNPEQSEIPEVSSLRTMHDFIRMLDADAYPRAFLEHRGYRYEFGRAALRDGKIVADVTITPAPRPGASS